MINFKDYIDDIPDFPQPGIIFRDIAPLLAQKFPETIEAMLGLFSDAEIERADAFAGIDARGFIFASALAMRTRKNLLVVRKAGKLPPPTLKQTYDLEYGSAAIEMKTSQQSRVLLIDDVLATGGTLRAAADLCTQAGHDVIGLGALIDLKFLNDFSWNGLRVKSLVQYD